ncbi:hypothetical protein FUA23_09210 [Neolewinella aurantiaca]|uniref:Uncharacterized protein n=1 Tax=Neolewinella aurantiaca TaxID=2602767 RepID=A0A5C7FJ04_9BACT|nr:hypothetical protein [Neolewinella aurantiaca]TXF89851.1 hypothetical protein FUA23_09210 [Neolewinella aurantiaca]
MKYNSLLVAFMFIIYSLISCSGESASNQISVNRIEVPLKCGDTIQVNSISYGLNGQHKRIFLSDVNDIHAVSALNDEIMFSGYISVYIFDALPKSIIYSTSGPRTPLQLLKRSDCITYQKVTGSDLYWLSKNNSRELIDILDKFN